MTIDEALIAALVPPQVRRVLAEPLRDTPALAEMRAWWSGTRAGQLLLGSVGCGKTIAACWPFTENFSERGVYMRVPGDMPPIRFWHGGTFASMSDLAVRSLWEADDRVFRDRCAETPLLVLDDVGAEPAQGISALQELVAHRMAEDKRTVMTSNLEPAAFKSRYGARVWDRLEGLIWNVTGPSLRGAA